MELGKGFWSSKLWFLGKAKDIKKVTENIWQWEDETEENGKKVIPLKCNLFLNYLHEKTSTDRCRLLGPGMVHQFGFIMRKVHEMHLEMV